MRIGMSKNVLILSGLWLLRACSARQPADLDSCTDRTAWGCGTQAANDVS